MNTHLTAVERQAESATAEGAGEALLHQENRHRGGSDLIQGLEDAVHDDGGESEGGVVGAGIAGRGIIVELRRRTPTLWTSSTRSGQEVRFTG